MPDDQQLLDPSQYATPQQLANQRLYAQKLLNEGMGTITPSSGGAVSPFQGLAGILEGVQGRALLRNSAAQERATNQGAGAASMTTTDGSDPNQQGPLSAPPPGPGSLVDKLLPAVARNEGSGSYTQLGPVTKTGDRAYGKYQVMGANIPQWSKEVLGFEMTPQQFLAMPEAQEAIARTKLGQYASQYGPEGALKAWFAGPTGMNNPNAKDQLGTTVAGYAQRGMANMAGMPKVAMAGPGLPTGALGPSPAPAGAPAATPAPAVGMLAATPPPAGGAAPSGAPQGTQVAAGPQGLSSAVPPMPTMGAPTKVPAGPGGPSPGMFAQRPRISPQQYYAIMSNPLATPEMKQNATAVWQSQNQPISFKSQYGTYVMSHDGQRQFIGDPVSLTVKTKDGEVPGYGFYNEDGSIRIAPIMGGAGAGGSAVPPPAGGQPPSPPPGPPPGPSGANQQAMPKFASLESGPVTDAGMLGANPPPKAVASAPASMPASVGPTAAPVPPPGGGSAPMTAGVPGGTQVAQNQSLIQPYQRDTINDLGTIAAEQERKKKVADTDVENYNKDYAQFQQMGLNAINNRQQIELAQHIIHDPHFTQGPGTPIKLAWEQAKAFLGDQTSQTNLAYNTAFDKVISGGILRDMKTLLGGWAGQVRNAEINLMNKASAGSANTIGANQAILDIADRSQKQLEDIGNLTNLYRQGYSFDAKGNPVIDKNGNYVMGGSPATSAGQNTIIRNYLQTHPLLSPAEIEHYNDVLSVAEKGGGGVAHGPLSTNPPAAPGAAAAPTMLPTLPPGAKVRPRSTQPEIPL
jgi:hypothetical protein